MAWPGRATPEKKIELRDLSGTKPVDLGRYARCRILSVQLAEDGRDWLLCASTYEKPNLKNAVQLKVVSTKGSFSIPLSHYGASYGLIVPSSKPQSRGLVVYLTGIMGLTGPEAQLVNVFALHGWNVLVSSVAFDFHARRQVRLRREAMNDVAREHGNELNELLADRAYAVESLLAYLQKAHPALLKGTRVLVGGSAGAMNLPAVAARIGKPDIAVLIGGGAPASRVIVESSLAAISLAWVEPETDGTFVRAFTATDRKQFYSAMLKHAPLDPARTAFALKGSQMLMLHGMADQIVPVETGDYLHELLGKPERWTYPMNHIVLFAMLHFNAGSVVNWVNEQADKIHRPPSHLPPR